jgi:phosphoribosylformylglycinamidine (FGAM) synthase PurS component
MVRGVSVLYRVRIVVRPREGVSDPEGETLSRRLKRKGIQGLNKIRSGKYWEVYIESSSREEAEERARQIYGGPPTMNPVKDDAQVLSIEEVQ